MPIRPPRAQRRRRDRRLRGAALAAAVIALLAGALLAPAAWGDGDPASDTLLGESVFYPYQPPVPASVQHTLNAETAAAKRLGFPIKVALIGRPLDLGVIPSLFGKPQEYAKFLDQEISFQSKQLLLVVMPSGYGTQGLPPAATAAAVALPPPAGHDATGLARAAIVAVARLAKADGHPIRTVPGVPGGPTAAQGSNALLLIVLGVAALLVAAALIVLRRRPVAEA